MCLQLSLVKSSKELNQNNMKSQWLFPEYSNNLQIGCPILLCVFFFKISNCPKKSFNSIFQLWTLFAFIGNVYFLKILFNSNSLVKSSVK